MTRIKGQLTTADYLPMDTFRKLIDALEEDHEYLWATYCWLSFCTAFRASDVRSLRWKDVLNRSQLVKMEQKTGKSRRVKFNRCVREKIHSLYELRGRPDMNRLIFMNPKAIRIHWNTSTVCSKCGASNTGFPSMPSPPIASARPSGVTFMKQRIAMPKGWSCSTRYSVTPNWKRHAAISDWLRRISTRYSSPSNSNFQAGLSIIMIEARLYFNSKA